MKVKTEFDFAKRWRIIQLKPMESVRRKRLQIRVGIAILLIIGIIGGSPWYYSKMLETRVEAINLEILNYKDVDNLLQREGELETNIKEKQQALTEIRASEHHPREVLESLGQRLPAGSVIQQFELVPDNTLAVSVSVLGPIDVARLWVSLRDSGLSVSNINTVSLSDERQSLEMQFKLK